ncbi:DUF2125 domain-containing protein [Roseovarius sp. A21]|uniref:DUF2125 domain-containing protein n=1 Tax=Roseovarius bejariae TaxID=2576383 RepID=A0A844CI81_9RHOB|nr:DUF2125 domain-containing protein [Roseovarius bejariae]MRU15031.1 DUF2125 domain-containing protein [Roseovarius bejariae]
MRLLLALLIAVVALWSGYWYIGSSGVQSGFAAWFGERRTEGWMAEYSDLTVQGFPSRFDTVIENLALADPDTGLAWEAPRFQINALSYNPGHVIAVWPDQQLIATPVEKYEVKSRDMRASVVVGASTRLPLKRSTLTAEALEVTPAGRDEPTRIEALSLAVETVPVRTDPTYRFGLRADGVAPSVPVRAQLDPRGSLPEALEALQADMVVEFDKPWDRGAIEEARPQPRRINVKLAQARWGRLELQAAGEVTVDARGVPTGEITVKARNWREILELAVTAGAIPEGFAGTLEDGLSLLSQMAGNPKTLDIPLGFRSGRVMLGPVPIGPSPVIRLR